VTDPIVSYSAAPFNGPQNGQSLLVDGVTAVPYEGVWLPASFYKAATLEVGGSISTLSLQLYGTNALEQPLNTVTVTVGGSKTTGDVLNIEVINQNLSNGNVTVSYTVLSGDSINSTAAALAALINANAGLQTLGLSAIAVGGVITITFPSAPSNLANNPSLGSPSAPLTQNQCAFVLTKSGGASETLTLANGTDGTVLGSAITALGLTAVSPLPVRWIKARVTTLTGGGANVSAALAGTA